MKFGPVVFELKWGKKCHEFLVPYILNSEVTELNLTKILHNVQQ